MDALTFLDKTGKSQRQPVYVLYGDEAFLKRKCRDKIVSQLLGDSDPEFAVTVLNGERELDISTVRNELQTLPFFAKVRIVVIDQADEFVSEQREALERHVAKPSPVGVLILDVKTFPATTKLAKALPDPAKLECKAPQEGRIQSWIAQWAKVGHGKIISHDASSMLFELVGASLGLLDQELGKLASAVGDRAEIQPEDVEQYVTRSKDANVFLIMDAIGDKNPKLALEILNQLFHEGEHALAILGALTSQLRKLSTVGRLCQEKMTFGQAMDAAGIPTWPKARMSAERQLKHLGLARVAQLSDWLVEINHGLKGGSELPDRVQMERLITQLAR